MHRDMVVIGGSAGALEPLKDIVAVLTPDLPAAVVVVLHLAPTSASALGPILNRMGSPQAVQPRAGDAVRPGFVYVPTADHHLEVTKDGFTLGSGPRINGVRPSIDVLFRSAARAYGERVIGVVLSGGLADGSAGLAAIRAAGGVGIVQKPDEALIDSMPRNAIATAGADKILPAAEIGAAIEELIGSPAKVGAGHTTTGGGVGMAVVGAHDAEGQVTGLTCPDCHGGIWMTADGGETTLRCRVGHAYSPESFFEIQSENVDNALWAGVRSLEEQASLAGVKASRAAKLEDAAGSRRFVRRRELANANAEILRRLVVERTDA